ncbi:Ig-like domain-containing protein [Aliagarivorans taiwanensis]|uniref:Ig-like domain-containing protein n=1 Tax=Aliagarivorans taiwanensis TaxID=561966 RepID=UPI000A014B87|nr:Ig-like domain-containing protein [Aliagarivorans taiwanensis]
MFVIISLLISGCGSGSSNNGQQREVKSIEIQGVSQILEGENTQLKAVISYDDDSVETGGVSWRSSDSTIASIDSNGWVTGHQLGVVVISAQKGDVVGQKTVEVVTDSTVILTEITLSGEQVLQVGQTTQINATAHYSDNSTSNSGFTYSSANSAVASVDNNGWVVAKATGSTQVSASKQGVTASPTITVNSDVSVPVVTDIQISNAPSSMQPGDMTSLEARAVYSDGSFTREVAWSSSNTAVASISSNGLLVANSAGDVTISAEKDKVIRSFNLSVKASNLGILSFTLDGPQQLQVGASEQYLATITYEDQSKVTNGFSWNSSNSAVASVDSNGIVNAKAAGSTTLTASKDGQSRSLTISVIGGELPTISEITLQGASQIEQGSSSLFIAKAIYSDGSELRDGFSWSSSNDAVASVSDKGLVTANQPGSATITAEKDGLKKTASVTIIAPEQGISIFVQDGCASHIHAWTRNGGDTPFFSDAWPGASISGLVGKDDATFRGERKGDVVELFFKDLNSIWYILNNNGDKVLGGSDREGDGDVEATRDTYYTSDCESHSDNPFDLSPRIVISPKGGEQRGDRVISVNISGDDIYEVEAFLGGQPLDLDHELNAEFTLAEHIANGESIELTAMASNIEGTTSDSATFIRNDDKVAPSIEAYGTLLPFAEHAIYFMLTDRFANGNTGNDQRDQGCAVGRCTFDQPVNGVANIGWMGGDFEGIYNNADYLSEMGFGAIWISPIIENPNEAFTGSCHPGVGAIGCDKGKTGFHGYWGVNFYKVDPHWESPGFTFKEFTDKMRSRGIKTVLDIVTNHGSPSFDMTGDQYSSSTYGKLYDKHGSLVAQTNNQQGGHDWFKGNDQLATLADFNINYQSGAGKEVFDYLVGAYKQWIAQGADAFRIDTTKHMSEAWFREFLKEMRKPEVGGEDFYAFGEYYDIDSGGIGHWQKNVGMDKLDFPYMYSMKATFGGGGAGYEKMLGVLHIDTGTIQDPYRTATFYDNHDMDRICADSNGFINAHNWLFTTRGIPIVYYGSEMAFEQCKTEHGGNRNFFGQDRINQAKSNPIYKALSRVGQMRRDNVALQRGLQFNIDVRGNEASILRVYQHDGVNQTALVLLNKNSSSTNISVNRYLTPGSWRDAETGDTIEVANSISAEVPANGIKVYIYDEPIENDELEQLIDSRMQLHGYK